MSISEQQETKEKYYSEAIRYMDNAKECLKKAQKDNFMYHDQKYVRMACGTAYSGLLVALDCFFILKGVHGPNTKKIRKSIEYYQKKLTDENKKLRGHLNIAYQNLHLFGYYDGAQGVHLIKEGFDNAYAIIDQIKPTGLNGSSQNAEQGKTAKSVHTTKQKS